ncbi:unnamed protein product [Bursaphelenchus xylophilus]|uniref:(pine wood nematode) hypothetical protein n=1 Tax=Bursaphelenchus xylophilus TaxID=6326 RepID=A0A1I7SQV2_BURXY|nr:unnamed protein product [Bursaphelenchus xylophilus]CAG9110436.1 unnamed protein product [Bursaphelenchus xylophilus]
MGVKIFAKNWIYWTDSFVAFNHISQTKKKRWRMFWTLVAVVLVGLFLYQSYQLISEYLQYGKSTAITIQSSNTEAFPAVTICNLNPFKRSQIYKVPQIQALQNAYGITIKQKMEKRRKANATTYTPLVAAKRRKREATMDSNADYSKTKQPDPENAREMTFESINRRFKRDTCSQSTVTSTADSSITYQLSSCTNDTSSSKYFNATFTCASGSTYTVTGNNEFTSSFQQTFDIIYKSCAQAYLCNPICNGTNFLGVVDNLGHCSGVATSNYPPASGDPDPMWPFAVAASKSCGFSDGGSLCSTGFEDKPVGVGYYSYRTCNKGSYNALTINIDQCDTSGTDVTPYKFNVNPNCSDAISQLASDFSNAYSTYVCAYKCTDDCPYTLDNSTCGNSGYYDELCRIINCENFTTIEPTTTDLTTELTTILTTEEPTTAETSTTETTTVISTTEEATTTAETTTVLTEEPTTILTTEEMTTAEGATTVESTTQKKTTEKETTLQETTNAELTTTEVTTTTVTTTTEPTTTTVDTTTEITTTTDTTTTPTTTPSTTSSTTTTTTTTTVSTSSTTTSTTSTTTTTTTTATATPTTTTLTSTKTTTATPTTTTTTTTTPTTTTTTTTTSTTTTTTPTTTTSTSTTSTFTTTATTTTTSANKSLDKHELFQHPQDYYVNNCWNHNKNIHNFTNHFHKKYVYFDKYFNIYFKANYTKDLNNSKSFNKHNNYAYKTNNFSNVKKSRRYNIHFKSINNNNNCNKSFNSSPYNVTNIFYQQYSHNHFNKKTNFTENDFNFG